MSGDDATSYDDADVVWARPRQADDTARRRTTSRDNTREDHTR